MKGPPREPLVFVLVLLAAGALSWHEYSGTYVSTRAPSPKTMELPAVERPPEVRLGPLTDAPPRAREESVFAPPRELLPLDPLKLPEPPLPRLAVRRPSVLPGLQGGLSAAYRISADDLGHLVLKDEQAASAPSGAASSPAPEPVKPADPKPADKTKPGSKPPVAKAGSKDAAAAVPDDSALEERHDWVVRQGRPRIWGRILNDDPVGLPQRPGEDLSFQQVSPATGGPLGVPMSIPRTEVLEYGLAKTLENDYHTRSRALGHGSGAAVARRALALEMLDRSATAPEALPLAVEEAQLAQAAAPGDPAVLRLMATVKRVTHDLPGEMDVYLAAEKAGVLEPALLAAHARLARELGLRERAWELVNKADLAGRPTAEAPVMRALLLLDESRYAEALTALRSAESLPFSGPREALEKRELQVLLGETLVALGNLDEAEKQTGRVLLDAPQDVRALCLQGALQDARGQLDQASASFAAALAIDPESARALTNAGVVAWQQGDGDGARRLLRRAADADPVRAVTPILALGFVLEDAGRQEEARDTYAGALVLEPGHSEALYRLGRRQRQDGDPAAATATLRQALALSGPETLLLLELSRAALDLAHWDDAQRYAREAERLEPDNADVQWNLGLAQLYAGDVLGCVAPLQKAAKAGARGADVALAVALYRQGQPQAALDQFDEVLKAFAGRDQDPQAVYAAAESAAIRDNLAKRQWVDRFGRSALQRGWSEHVWDGSPKLFLDGGAVHVAGRMEHPRDDERPGITRGLDGRAFFACEAEIEPGAPGETRTGLSLTHIGLKGNLGNLPKARLSIWVDADGQIKISALDSFDTQVLAETATGASVAPGARVKLGIERLDAVSGRFAFSVDGRRVGPEVECRTLRTFSGRFDLAVWAESAPGRQTDATVRLVRVVQAP